MTGDGESEVLLEFNWKFGMDFDKVVSKHVWIYVRMWSEFTEGVEFDDFALAEM